MDLWVWYTLAGIITIVLIILADYNLSKGSYKNPEFPQILTSSFMIFPFVYGIINRNIFYTELYIIIWSVISGLAVFLGSYMYFKALFGGITPGTITSIAKIQMVFAFIFGILIFGESLTKLQLLGHGIIFGGAILLSFSDFKVSNNKKLLLIPFASALSWSVAIILLDYLFKYSNFWTVFSFFALGHFLGVPIILFFTKNGKKFFSDFGERWQFYIIIAFITEGLNVLLLFFENMALFLGPLSKVTFLKETFPVILIIVSMIGFYFYPKYFPKEGGNNKFKTLVIVVIMLIGVYFTIK